MEILMEEFAYDLATGGTLNIRRADITPSQLLATLGPVADRKAVAEVPCETCTACCWYGRTDVKIEEEKPEDLVFLNMECDESGYYLAHREDGGCIHLGPDGGCSVHAHRPLVCRAYDCRVLGLAGLAPQSSHGHTAPVWEFPIITPLDKAIIVAARHAATPYIEAAKSGRPDPEGNVLVAIMRGIYEYLPSARAMVALFDSMPVEEQMRLAEASLM
jgi:hypothetical protein